MKYHTITIVVELTKEELDDLALLIARLQRSHNYHDKPMVKLSTINERRVEEIKNKTNDFIQHVQMPGDLLMVSEYRHVYGGTMLTLCFLDV